MLSRTLLWVIVAGMAAGCGSKPSQPSVDKPEAVDAPRQSKSVDQPDSTIAQSEANDKSLPLRQWLSVEKLHVRVMQDDVTPRHVELMQRFKAAIQEDPEWWLEHTKKAGPGGTIAYNPRLGMTAEEYVEFIKLNFDLKVKEGPEATVSIVENPPGVFTLNSDGKLPGFAEIEVDLNTDQVATPFGLARQSDEINTDESILGPWHGVEWKFVAPATDENASIVKFALGRHKVTKRGILIYDVKYLGPEGKVRISHILSFDVPNTLSITK